MICLNKSLWLAAPVPMPIFTNQNPLVQVSVTILRLLVYDNSSLNHNLSGHEILKPGSNLIKQLGS